MNLSMANDRVWRVAVLALAVAVARIADGRDDKEPTIRVSLGDYRFTPAELQLRVGEPAVLELVNSDRLTPHNFTLKDAAAGFDISIDVGAGDSQRVMLTPVTPGRYLFYCNKKLPFLKSHRARGMEGVLLVVP